MWAVEGGRENKNKRILEVETMVDPAQVATGDGEEGRGEGNGAMWRGRKRSAAAAVEKGEAWAAMGGRGVRRRASPVLEAMSAWRRESRDEEAGFVT